MAMAIDSDEYLKWAVDAASAANKYVIQLGIPWEDLQLSREIVRDGDLTTLSEHLALVAEHLTTVSRSLAKCEVERGALQDMLDFALNVQISNDETTGRMPAVAVRQAAHTVRTSSLLQARRLLVGLDARRTALIGARDSLEQLWRTITMVLSARKREREAERWN